MLAQHRRAQPGVEGAGEASIVAQDQTARAPLPARAGEDRVVETALRLVELDGCERLEPGLRAAQR
jgi:hypothetical protein